MPKNSRESRERRPRRGEPPREPEAAPPLPSSAGGRLLAWVSRWENLLFAALIVVHLIPLWSYRFFPTQDGPVAINNGNILRQYNNPDLPAFREYLTISDKPDPNWVVHLILAGLMFFFPPLIAEKIILSGYVLLLPLSVRYAIRSIRPESSFIAVLSFPFIYNYLLHVGFYNFMYSLPVFFYLVGCRIRHPGKPALRHAVLLATLAALLYFCHIVSLVLAIAMLGLLDVWLALCDAASRIRKRESAWGAFIESFRPRVLWTIIILVPSLLLSALFLSKQGTETTPHLDFAFLFTRLIHGDSLVAHTLPELDLATAVAAFLFAVLIYLIGVKIAQRALNRWDGLLIVAALFTWIYFVAPEGMSGGKYISYRLNLYPFFALILWFGSQAHPRFGRIAIQLIGAGLAAVFLLFHAAGYAEINDYLDEYTSGSSLIEPNSTLLPLCYSHYGRAPDGRPLSFRAKVFLHAGGYIGAMRNVVDMDNYQANSTYFPTMWRPELNPFVKLPIVKDGLESAPPCVDFQTYPKRTGGRVDYVLLWGLDDTLRQHKCTQLTFQQLQQGFDLIYTSPQRGLMQLYRRKDWVPRTAAATPSAPR
jgi:hypothetical protein